MLPQMLGMDAKASSAGTAAETCSAYLLMNLEPELDNTILSRP